MTVQVVGFASVLLLLVNTTELQGQLYSINLPKTLIAVDDKLYLAAGLNEPGNAVDIVHRSELKVYSLERSIKYPLDGEDPVLSVDSQGTSSKWNLSKVTGSQPGGPVTAKEGKFVGWYLDWSDDEVEVVYKGKAIKVKRMILAKEPMTIRTFHKWPVSK